MKRKICKWIIIYTYIARRAPRISAYLVSFSQHLWRLQCCYSIKIMFQLPLSGKIGNGNQMRLLWKIQTAEVYWNTIYVYACGIAQKWKIAGSLKVDMYFKQSSTCVKAFVTMSFRHCTAFTEFSSYFKSWEHHI